MAINGATKGTLPLTNQKAATVDIHSQLLSEMLTIVRGLRSSVDEAMNRLEVHESRLNELHAMVNVILSKVVIVETKLDKPTKICDSKLSQSPAPRSKRSGTPTLKQKRAAKSPSPFNRSKPSWEDNVENIILLTSDDDTNSKLDNNIKHSSMPNMTSKMKHKLSPARNPEKSSKKLSSFATSSKATTSRRLPFTAFPNERQLKIPKLEIKGENMMSKLDETNFVTTQELKLKPIEEQVAYYVFHAKNDLSEELFKIETITCLRKNFQTLCPGRIIDTEIIHIMSLKTTWIERNVAFPSIWSLPPSFVRDVNRGTKIEELVNEYAKNWMPHFENLKHIYLPIEDCVGNWFLMVASVQDQILYHLDPGFEKTNIIPRQETIKDMWEVITQMVQTMVQINYFPHNYLFEAQHKDNWDMAEPVGLVSEGFCQHSAVWVLQWLAMGSSFTPNIYVTTNEDVVRMKVAIDLLLGDHNEYKDSLRDMAEKAWQTE